MTVMAFAEHIEKCMSDRAADVRVEKSNTKVTYTAAVGNQAFRVTIEDLAKDAQEPAST